MAAANRVTKKKTILYRFSEKHKEYIRRCRECSYNVAEGAVRAGKTVDNVFAFAHELNQCYFNPDGTRPFRLYGWRM